MEDPLDKLVGLIPAFIQEVMPPLDGQIAECLAIYWFIAIANDSIDSDSAGQVADRIIPILAAKTWSIWHGNVAGFHTRFLEMCQAMAIGKRVAMEIGAGSASFQDQRMLFVMNVTKSALATAGLDDTDASLVEPVMMKLGELHAKAWPIVRTAGRPKSITPIAAHQGTGCLLLLTACTILLAGGAIAAGGSI